MQLNNTVHDKKLCKTNKTRRNNMATFRIMFSCLPFRMDVARLDRP